MNIFHIAIPTHDLEAATQFYTALGAIPARRRDDHRPFAGSTISSSVISARTKSASPASRCSTLIHAILA